MEYYNFKTYIPRGSKILKDNVVVLTKNHITLAMNLQKMVKDGEVGLKYDTDKEVMCIDFNNNGLKVRNGKIGSTGFYKFFGIQAKRIYEGKLENACLIVELK